jgi:hypothetical protein
LSNVTQWYSGTIFQEYLLGQMSIWRDGRRYRGLGNWEPEEMMATAKKITMKQFFKQIGEPNNPTLHGMRKETAAVWREIFKMKPASKKRKAA